MPEGPSVDDGKQGLEIGSPRTGHGAAGVVRERPPSDGAPPTDDELIDAALAGDGDAFGRLAERHQDRLYNSLLRFTGSAEDARDIAQDALVQALVKLDRFRRDSAFFTWLYRIAFNRAVSAGRKRRERVSLDALSDAGGEPHCADDRGGERPEARSLASERAELVHRALATLAEEHRQVLVLREFEELDYGQIAEIVATPVGTVRSRLFRARSQLREALTRLGIDETS